MAKEIERKYLLDPAVLSHANVQGLKPDSLIQAYLSKQAFDIRARIANDTVGTVCIKQGRGLVRNEYEYVVPLKDAEEMIAACDNLVQKNRYTIKAGRDYFELDEYFGNNAGLVTVEIELRDETQAVVFPDWLAPFVQDEVTGNKKYANSTLAYNNHDEPAQ